MFQCWSCGELTDNPQAWSPGGPASYCTHCLDAAFEIEDSPTDEYKVDPGLTVQQRENFPP